MRLFAPSSRICTCSSVDPKIRWGLEMFLVGSRAFLQLGRRAPSQPPMPGKMKVWGKSPGQIPLCIDGLITAVQH